MEEEEKRNFQIKFFLMACHKNKNAGRLVVIFRVHEVFCAVQFSWCVHAPSSPASKALILPMINLINESHNYRQFWFKAWLAWKQKLFHATYQAISAHFLWSFPRINLISIEIEDKKALTNIFIIKLMVEDSKRFFHLLCFENSFSIFIIDKNSFTQV